MTECEVAPGVELRHRRSPARRSKPRIARLFASVPPLVKITRSASRPVVFAPSSSPIRSRASSSTAGAAAEFVLAGRVQVRLGVARAHRLDDLRQHRRRGVVVEIDRFVPLASSYAEIAAQKTPPPASNLPLRAGKEGRYHSPLVELPGAATRRFSLPPYPWTHCMESLKTAFRLVVMLAVVGIGYKAWQHYGPPAAQVKALALRASRWLARLWKATARATAGTRR